MALILKGSEIPLTDMKKGEGSKGVWCMIPVKEKAKTITVFADNPEEVTKEWGSAIVKEITCCKYSSRKVNDKWYDSVAINAVLEKGSDIGFMSIPDGTDDISLPFN